MVENPALYQVFCQALPVIYNVYDTRRAMSSDFTIESALGAVRYLERYQDIVELFTEGLKGLELHSEGMRAFRDQIFSIAESDEYRNLCQELGQMETRFGSIKSVSVGINLDGTLHAESAGIISVEKEYFHEGTIVDRLLQKKPRESHALISPLYPLGKGLKTDELKALNYSIRSALNMIYKKALRSFEPAVQKYYSINTSFLIFLLDGIRFLTAGVKFILSMKEAGSIW